MSTIEKKLNKKHYWIIGTVSTLISLGMLTNVLMQIYLSPMVEHFAREELYESSKGLYIVDSMEVEWGVLNSSLTINNFHITSDSLKWEKRQANDSTSPPILDLFIPKIEVERINILELYRDKHLKAGELKISKPIVHLFQGEQKPDTTYSSWQEFIPKNLKSFKIDKIDINEGHIELQAFSDTLNTLGIQKLNISIDDILFDSTLQLEDSPLSLAQDIYVSGNLTQYPFFLESYLHQVRLGKFEFHSAQKNLRLKDIHLEPLFPSHTIDSLVSFNLDIQIPEIQFRGIEPEALLNSRQLKLDKLLIKKPQINYTLLNGIIESDTSDNAFRLPFFQHLGVDSIVVEDGSYFSFQTEKDSLPYIDMRGIGMKLGSVLLEDSLLHTDHFLSILQSLSVEVDSFHLHSQESAYHFYSGNIGFQADSGILHLQQLQLLPEKNPTKTQLLSQIPEIVVQGIDLQKFIGEQRFSADILRIRRPQMDLYQHWSSADSQLIATWTELDGYHLIRDAMQELQIGNLRIEEGRLAIFQPQASEQSTFQASDIQLDIQQFTISPHTHHLMRAPFFATDFNLGFNINGSSLILPDSSYSLAASSIAFSTGDSTLSADSVLLIPLYPDSSHIQDQQKILLGIPHIRLKGLDFYRAYFQREVSLDSLWISTPKIQWKQPFLATDSTILPSIDSIELYPILKPFVQMLSVDFFALEEAEISREIMGNRNSEYQFYPKLSLTFDHFILDSTSQLMGERLLYSDDIKVKLGKIEQWMPDSLHHVTIDEITYTTSDRHIFVDTIRLKSNTPSPESQTNLYDVIIPNVRINGFDVMELYKEKQLTVDDVQIIKPLVHLINYPEVVKEEIDSLAQANLYDFISDYLNALNIHNLVVRDGEVILRNWDQKKENAFHADDLLVFIKDFSIDSTSWANTTNRFYARDIDIGMDANNYSFVLPDSTYLLQIGSIGMSTQDSLLSAKKVSLVPIIDRLKSREADLMWNIEIPHFQIKGFEPAQWYFHQIARLKHVRIFQPKINMEHLQPAKPVEHDPMKVYNFISQHFKDLYIKDLFVEGASFQETRHPADTLKPLVLNNLSLRAMNISPDSSDFLSPAHLFYSDNVRLSLKDYKIDLPKQAYEITFGEVGMHTASNQLYANDLHISPQLNIEEFFYQHGFSRDFLDFKIPDVKAEGVDLDALMHDQDFKADRLLLQGLTIKAKKDKSYPENPNKRPPMGQELIRQLPFYLKIDTITIADGKIDFEQKVPNLKKDARFYMHALHANLFNLTNDSLLMAMGVEVILKADSRIMETGQISVDFIIPLADTTNEYSFSGEIGRMNLSEFNPFLEQSAFVFVTNGLINHGVFEVNAFKRLRKRKQEYIYKGKMRMRYSDLKLAVIDKKTMFERDEYDEKKMASFLANTFVRSNNPKGRGRFLRVGKIFYKKEDNKAMIGHWVQALTSGVRSSVGLENKDDRERIIIPGFGKKKKEKKKGISNISAQNNQ